MRWGFGASGSGFVRLTESTPFAPTWMLSDETLRKPNLAEACVSVEVPSDRLPLIEASWMNKPPELARADWPSTNPRVVTAGSFGSVTLNSRNVPAARLAVLNTSRLLSKRSEEHT